MKICIEILIAIFVAGMSTSMSSCTTTKDLSVSNDFVAESLAESASAEEKQASIEAAALKTEEELRIDNISDHTIYVQQPVYVPAVEPEPEMKTGIEAVAESGAGIVEPRRYSEGLFSYDYNDKQTYKVFCKPWHATEVILEPGEYLVSPLFITEPDVWDVGAAAFPHQTGQRQHFIFKPALTKLETSCIIFTNRRVYRLLLISENHKDYMAMVNFNYPRSMSYELATRGDKSSLLDIGLSGVDPRFLSVDYKIKYSRFKTPKWLPEFVYDDGKKTYILLPKLVLHTKLPVLFQENRALTNYRWKDNLCIIDGLYDRLTLRLGTAKVTIDKKKSALPTESTSYDSTRPETARYTMPYGSMIPTSVGGGSKKEGDLDEQQ